MKALDLDETNTNILCDLARFSYDIQQNGKRAERYAIRAVKSDENNINALVLLANYTNDEEISLKCLRKASKLTGDKDNIYQTTHDKLLRKIEKRRKRERN